MLLALLAQSAYNDTFIFQLRLALAPSPNLKGTHRKLLSLREGPGNCLLRGMQEMMGYPEVALQYLCGCVLRCEYVWLWGWGQIGDKDHHKERKSNLLLLKTKRQRWQLEFIGQVGYIWSFPSPQIPFSPIPSP